MTTPGEFEEWLKLDPYPDHVWKSRIKTNAQLVSYRTSMDLVWNCLDAARQESGAKDFTLEVKGDMGALTHTISYTISNVTITPICTNGHSFGEWKYDFMGGDVRKCSTCGLHEFA